jgi:hypothetical protein
LVGGVAIHDSPFSYTDREKRAQADHPLRVIEKIIKRSAQIVVCEFAEPYSPSLGG